MDQYTARTVLCIGWVGQVFLLVGIAGSDTESEVRVESQQYMHQQQCDEWTSWMKVKTLTDDNILYKQGLRTLQNSNRKHFFLEGLKACRHGTVGT